MRGDFIEQMTILKAFPRLTIAFDIYKHINKHAILIIGHYISSVRFIDLPYNCLVFLWTSFVHKHIAIKLLPV